MAKAVKEFDIVLNKDEIKAATGLYQSYIKNVAIQYFRENGMTMEEIEQKVQFHPIVEHVSYYDNNDGQLPYSIIDEIIVPVTVEQD